LTAKRFFASTEQIRSPYIILKGREHHHLSRVVRIQTGQIIEVFDEKGKCYFARVDHIDPSITRLRIIESFKPSPSRVQIILAPALIKAKAMELTIQKAAELGAASISPVIAERSVVKFSGDMHKKISRWKKIILDAAKQSGRSGLPEIKTPVTLSVFLKAKHNGMGFCLTQDAEHTIKEMIFELSPPENEVILLVGPEGDWTEPEKKAIVQHGFRMASLGRMTLRSETAAISGLAIFSHFWMS
jgi:16S rRNA (uracil1498-N3)-methyltransferase